MKSLILLSLSCVLSFSVHAADPNKERPLRVVYFGEDISAVHHLSSTIDPDSAAVFANIFDSLVHPSLDGEITPGLATSWKRHPKALFPSRDGSQDPLHFCQSVLATPVAATNP